MATTFTFPNIFNIFPNTPSKETPHLANQKSPCDLTRPVNDPTTVNGILKMKASFIAINI